MIERHAAQALALRERYPKLFNIQFSIVNSSLSGLGYNKMHVPGNDKVR
jgi:hypothetical protein